MSQPSETAVKTLFALSRNVCCWAPPPGESGMWGGACEEKMTDPVWRQVNGEVAHIKGEKPTSARYDADQSDDERQGFYNLMLVCPKHHKLIDRLAPEVYTVEVLISMKERHLEHKAPMELFTEEQLADFARQAIAETVRSASAESGQQIPRDVNVEGRTGEVKVDAPAGSVTVGRHADDQVAVHDVATRSISAARSGAEVIGVTDQVTGHRPRLAIEREVTAIDLVNVGDADAYSPTIEAVNDATGAGLSLAAIPANLLEPGQRWRAGAFVGHFADGEEYQVHVSWRDASGRPYDETFVL